jgi:hypothetical protein
VHERWDYDDATGMQTLRRLLALCRGCHASTLWVHESLRTPVDLPVRHRPRPGMIHRGR